MIGPAQLWMSVPTHEGSRPFWRVSSVRRCRPGVVGARLRRLAEAKVRGKPRTAGRSAVTALLRPAVEGDLLDVVRIERACFADPWTEESFGRLLAGQPAIFLVAVLPPDSAIAGYVIAFSVGEDAELLNVAVDPGFRGRGLAGQMLDAVLIELGSRGVRTAFLEVRESNARGSRALWSEDFRDRAQGPLLPGGLSRIAGDAKNSEVAEGDEERSAVLLLIVEIVGLPGL